jgi:membrane protein
MHEFAANLRMLLRAMRRQAADLKLQQTASSLTLLTLGAIVPMAAVGLMLITALPAFESMRLDIERFLATNLFLPSFSATIIRYLNQFLAAAGKLSAIGTVAFCATAITSMLTIDRTLNQIWRTPRPRPLAQRMMLYWTLLTIGPVLLGGALAIQTQLSARMRAATGITDVMGGWLPAVLGIGALSMLYWLAPNDRVRWRHALLGALVAVGLLELLNLLLGLYVTRFPSYTIVYGAFAALPLFLLWLFAAWMSVLIGALVAANLRFWGAPLGDPHVATPSAEFERMVRILAVLVRESPRPVPSERFRAEFDGDAKAADQLGALLASQSYLMRVWPVRADGGSVSVWDEYWLPTAELPHKTLRALFDRVWSLQPGRATSADRQPLASTIDPGSPLLERPLSEVLALPARGDRSI